MVEDRIPGTPGPRMKQYECRVPGCKERKSSFGKPDCPKHKLPMKLSSPLGR